MGTGTLSGPSLTRTVSLGCSQAIWGWTLPLGCSGTCRSTAQLAHTHGGHEAGAARVTSAGEESQASLWGGPGLGWGCRNLAQVSMLPIPGDMPTWPLAQYQHKPRLGRSSC